MLLLTFKVATHAKPLFAYLRVFDIREDWGSFKSHQYLLRAYMFQALNEILEVPKK